MIASLSATTFKKVGQWKPLIWLAIFSLWLAGASLVKADSAQDSLEDANGHIEKASAAAQAGDLNLAKQEYQTFNKLWLDIEDGVKAKSKDSYVAIEQKITAIEIVLSKTPVDNKALAEAFDQLVETNDVFIKAKSAGANGTTAPTATINTVLAKLDEVRSLQAKGDYAAATQGIKDFKSGWLDVEGVVKTRSPQDYSQTENDIALATDLLTQQSPRSQEILNRLYSRLSPYTANNRYGIFDATLILLREGLEALLVVVALLTFLKKSGNPGKQGWVWAGVGAGIGLSVLLAVVIQLIFSNTVNSSNRELVEGLTGLIAATMLIYVSYWMHSKSSAGAWQQYIKRKSTAAMAKGSLIGLSLLAFLSIFREGAETALFYLGIGPSISTGDLVIGLGLGMGMLVGLGVLLIVVGIRLPMGPFFRVASLLVFFLCFKFIGTGIHALQLAGVLPNHPAEYLPANDFFGTFSSWEPTAAQLVLVAAAIGAMVYQWNKYRVRPGKIDSTALGAAK